MRPRMRPSLGAASRSARWARAIESIDDLRGGRRQPEINSTAFHCPPGGRSESCKSVCQSARAAGWRGWAKQWGKDGFGLSPPPPGGGSARASPCTSPSRNTLEGMSGCGLRHLHTGGCHSAAPCQLFTVGDHAQPASPFPVDAGKQASGERCDGKCDEGTRSV